MSRIEFISMAMQAHNLRTNAVSILSLLSKQPKFSWQRARDFESNKDFQDAIYVQVLQHAELNKLNTNIAQFQLNWKCTVHNFYLVLKKTAFEM